MGVEMMIGMGLIWLLVVMVLIGAVAALWKYLRSDKARDE
ncbi:putative membrane protein [Alteromonas macleodii]|uniref:Membrane protein n=1 Tax=Alteromonas macleodii TaxID=28108 RepID=A0AB36FQS2_ALTMA|nr:putative membrane protein [Alteromonas macleodii]OES28780.1 putative membrane protein [Alteromonas macleodii]OES29194.1 putative membrane protein [Alteromonas macleodii]OES40263.1 putative membrane protein [Alteromonas macleodii]|tara:strand:- start:523 stop:642 length:120 start_codon:yes stop_codon:yes gene_type:complete